MGQGFDHPAVGLAKSLGFGAFLHHPHTVSSLSGWPAARYLTDATGGEHAGMFLRLEHIEADTEALAARLGLRLDVPHVNRSGRQRDYRLYYDDALAAHLGAVCAQDIARFGYRFDG